MKISRLKAAVLMGAVLLSFAAASPAANTTSEGSIEGSNRMKNKIGGYVGILGDPFPTLVGLNLAYNVFDFMRATAGFGQVSVSIGDSSTSATTIGGGVRFFVPGWSISPMAGLSFANVSVSQSGPVAQDIKGLTESTSIFYASLGADWQASSGFNVGLGYNLPFKSGVGGAPYLNLGWFFGFL